MNNTLLTSASPHIHSGASVPRMMRDVVYALLPCVIAALLFFDPLRVAALIAVCVGAAVLTELLCRLAMRRDNTVGDYSAVVTGLLLALTLPVGLPLWQAALGSVFAIAVVKQVFGGLGHNPFNPALAARAFLIVSFAAKMTEFIPITTATPLGAVKLAMKTGEMEGLVYDSASRLGLFLGNVNGSIGETSALAILAGFAYLMFRRVITWHATAGYMGSVALFALCHGAVFPQLAMPPDFHLMAGGALFGAVFMATDSVTTPVTAWGRFVFGVGCGVLTMVIRVVPNGAYPEGVTFAILIMNALTPLINRATRYNRFGAGKR